MSDYQILYKQCEELLLENQKLTKEIKMLKLQNKIINETSLENEQLKKEIYELKLLLDKRINKYMEAMTRGR